MNRNHHFDKGLLNMQILSKEMTFKAIQQALLAHQEIEVIDYSLPEPYISGTNNHDGITLDSTRYFDFHYSIFHKVFPYIFDLYSMEKFEYACWRTLMAMSLINGYSITFRTHDNFSVILEVDSGRYLDLRLEPSPADHSYIKRIVASSDITHESHEYFSYEDVFNRFLLPMLNVEAKEFELSFKSADDLTDETLLILSALIL
jgi:hypothetical protein